MQIEDINKTYVGMYVYVYIYIQTCFCTHIYTYICVHIMYMHIRVHFGHPMFVGTLHLKSDLESCLGGMVQFHDAWALELR